MVKNKFPTLTRYGRTPLLDSELANKAYVDATAAGEVNTASNVGAGAGDVFKAKVGVDLELKTILAGTNITVTNNVSDIEIAAAAVAPVLTNQESVLTSDKVITSTSFVDSGLTLTMPTRSGGKAMITFEGTSLATGGGLNSVYKIVNDGTSLFGKEDSMAVNLQNQISDSAIVDLDGQVVKVQMKTNGQTLTLKGTASGDFIQATLKSLEIS